jgi:PBP1b-binding outer membrane lipoprotein LpoB
MKIVKSIILCSILLSGCSQLADKPVTITKTITLKVIETGKKNGEDAAIVRYNNELQSVNISSKKGEYITINVLSDHTLEVAN